MASIISLYAALARLAFQRAIAYRAATLSGLVTNMFFGMLRVAVMRALYGGQLIVAGMSLSQAIAFTGLTQALATAFALWGWWDVIDQIREGAVATDLLRPFDYHLAWFARDVGRASATLVFRGLPIFAVYLLFIDMPLPDGPGGWLAFTLSTMLALWVSFGLRFLYSMAAFWTGDARGIGRAFFSAMYFASGFIMPLRFLPGWLQTLCRLTPFPYVVTTPIDVYLGLLRGPALAQALGAQLLCAVALTVACQLFMRAGLRKLVIAGG